MIVGAIPECILSTRVWQYWPVLNTANNEMCPWMRSGLKCKYHKIHPYSLFMNKGNVCGFLTSCLLLDSPKDGSITILFSKLWGRAKVWLVELSDRKCAIWLSPQCKSKTEPFLVQYPRECHYEDSQLESVQCTSPSGSRLWAFSWVPGKLDWIKFDLKSDTELSNKLQRGVKVWLVVKCAVFPSAVAAGSGLSLECRES